jgi:hypothetical protein
MVQNKVVSTRQKDIPTSEKFLRRAKVKKARGEPYEHWVRAADILWRIENDLCVGHHRLKCQRGREADA